MNALVLHNAGEPLRWEDVPEPELAADDVLVRIKAAALNRRDLWIQRGQYAGLKFPIIPGSDGSGIVVKTGADVDPDQLGREVVIYPVFSWGDHSDYQGKDFRILGLPDNGTLAGFVRVKKANLFDKPPHLNWEQAAALPLAGLTAYRALFTKAKVQKGDTVLISGVGSGTGLFALQWAVAAGCRVFVTSGNSGKLEKARSLGAAGGVNYTSQDWVQQLELLSGGFDVIIDSALGEGFASFPDLAKPGGRIVFFGGTAGNIPELNGRKIFWKQLQILGTTMGSPDDFGAMLDLLNKNRIEPVIDEVFHASEGEQAMKKLDDSSRFGKIVLRVS
ncbi:MAG: zinc-binding dehydrogenase [Mucilaginibacter polytrichastri]|nr:zinc-binding dehydrogenase [Mucilaginibacter polytrichastri]